jgi:hypothetical protein
VKQVLQFGQIRFEPLEGANQRYRSHEISGLVFGVLDSAFNAVTFNRSVDNSMAFSFSSNCNFTLSAIIFTFNHLSSPSHQADAWSSIPKTLAGFAGGSTRPPIESF